MYGIYFLCKLLIMKKNIDETILIKLKMVSAFKNRSVKALVEKAVSFWVGQKGKEMWHALSEQEKADLGLLLPMQ